MNPALGTFLDIVALIALLTLFLLPAVVGAVNDHRIDVQLRDAEAGRDRRTGLLTTFDLAYGPHEDRVRRANLGRAAGPSGATGTGRTAPC